MSSEHMEMVTSKRRAHLEERTELPVRQRLLESARIRTVERRVSEIAACSKIALQAPRGVFRLPRARPAPPGAILG